MNITAMDRSIARTKNVNDEDYMIHMKYACLAITSWYIDA